MNIEELKNKSLTEVKIVNDDEIHFTTTDGSRYRMYHQRDGYETVVINEVCGDITDLIESPIIRAEERTSKDSGEERSDNYDSSNTWTFYELATVKGSVSIRWHGSSNGFYSESVDFEKVT